MRAMVIYFGATLGAWVPATMLLHRFSGPGDRLERVVGGLFVAIAWPLTMPALSFSMLPKRRVVSAPSANVGSLPNGLPHEHGRSDGPVRTLQSVRSNHPSAGEGHVRRGGIAPALLEASPRDHARGAL